MTEHYVPDLFEQCLRAGSCQEQQIEQKAGSFVKMYSNLLTINGGTEIGEILREMEEEGERIEIEGADTGGRGCIICINTRTIRWHETTREERATERLPATIRPPSEWLKGLLRLALRKLIFLILLHSLLRRTQNQTQHHANSERLPNILDNIINNEDRICSPLFTLLLGSEDLKSPIVIDEIPPQVPEGTPERACYRISLDPSAKAREIVVAPLLFSITATANDIFVRDVREFIAEGNLPYAMTALLALSAIEISDGRRAFVPLTAGYSEIVGSLGREYIAIKCYGCEEPCRRLVDAYEGLLKLIVNYLNNSHYLDNLLGRRGR